MENFDIHDYLEGFDITTGRGKCQNCSKTVTWNRARVRSHKRVSCPNASAAEKLFFAIKNDEIPSKKPKHDEDESNESKKQAETGTGKEVLKDPLLSTSSKI